MDTYFMSTTEFSDSFESQRQSSFSDVGIRRAILLGPLIGRRLDRLVDDADDDGIELEVMPQRVSDFRNRRQAVVFEIAAVDDLVDPVSVRGAHVSLRGNHRKPRAQC